MRTICRLSAGLGALTSLLAQGCSLSSTQESPRDVDAGATSPVVETGSDAGAGDPDASGPDATGGCGDLFKVCVDSCARDQYASDWAPLSQVCEDGAATCPGATFNYGTCATGTCARSRPYCCDLDTGDATRAPCQADGLRVCPPGKPETPSYSGCVPTALAGSGCVMALAGQPCAGPAHNCADAFVRCTCAAPDGGGATLWTCEILPLIP
jgi:hypothetical protein